MIALSFGATNSLAASAMRNEYTIKNDRLGINAYVYGKRTVLEFMEPPRTLYLFDAKNIPVQYERISEKYYRLARSVENFTAKINGDQVEFSMNKPEQFVTVDAAGNVGAVTSITASAVGPITTVTPPAGPNATVTPPAPPNATVTPPTAPAQYGEIGQVALVDLVAEKTVVAEKWKLEASDLSVFSAIKRWARKTAQTNANWQVSWEVPIDYPVTIVGTFEGTFEEAVSELMKGFRKAEYPPKACKYMENRVIRIVRLTGTGKECES
nr:TcpQ domain-containing protein [Janthinobacterium sp. FW305-128]